MIRKGDMPEVHNRIYGTLFGQAVGDALGLGAEFMTKAEARSCYPEGLTRYEQIVRDYHRTKFRPGAWTDDTDMMLCVARVIAEGKGIDLHAIAQNFTAWLHDPETRGVGRTTYNVLMVGDYVETPQQVAELVWEMSRKQNASNGAVMRSAATGLLKDGVARAAEDVCKLTHFDPRCIGSCVIVSEIISHLIWHNRQLSYNEIMETGSRYDSRIAEYINKAHNGSLASLELDEPSTIGYTLKALGAGLCCMFHAHSFEEGLLAVINEAGDADTNAAVAGAILGAKYGYASIPQQYIDGLKNKEELARIAQRIAEVEYQEHGARAVT